jgi:hypothetical protein
MTLFRHVSINTSSAILFALNVHNKALVSVALVVYDTGSRGSMSDRTGED